MAQPPKIIRREELGADASPWTMPEVAGKGEASRSATTVAEPPLKPPTASEIEAIVEQARQEGFREGQEEGYREGVAKGEAEGRKKGEQEGYAAGFARGLDEGREQGRREGLDTGMAEAAGRMQLLERLLQSTVHPLVDLDSRVEQELLALALEIARNVIRQDVEAHPDKMAVLVRQALRALPVSAQQPEILLHPKDLAVLRSMMPELEENGVGLVEDESLEPGDCRVLARAQEEAVVPDRRWRDRAATGAGIEVDATLQARWSQTVSALFSDEKIV